MEKDLQIKINTIEKRISFLQGQINLLLESRKFEPIENILLDIEELQHIKGILEQEHVTQGRTPLQKIKENLARDYAQVMHLS